VVIGVNLAHADPTAPAPTAPPTGGIKSLPRQKIIYLTFDDGPHKIDTPKILDVLKNHGVTATFFVLGERIKGREELLKREVAEGHIVGNHQWEHNIIKDAATFSGQVTQTRDAIANAVGSGNPLYFRYPYGAKAPWKETILKTAGYADGGVYWDIDSN